MSKVESYYAPEGDYLVVTKEWRLDHPEAVLAGNWKHSFDTEALCSCPDGRVDVPRGSPDPKIPTHSLRKWPWPQPE